MASDADAPRARVGGGPVRGPRLRPRRGSALVLRASSTASANAFAAPPRRARSRSRRSGGGDDGEPGRVRGRGARHQQARRRRGAAQPGVEGGRGRPRRRADRARCTPSPTATRPRSSPRCLVADRVTDLDASGVLDAALGGDRSPLPHRNDQPRPTSRCWCSARARPGCPRRCATRTPRWATPPATGSQTLGLGPDDRFQVATPPSHILGLLNLLAAASAGATVRLHRRFDLDEVLRRDRERPHDPRDGGGADRAGDGEPPAPRGLRPLVAPLHHVGRHAGHRAAWPRS